MGNIYYDAFDEIESTLDSDLLIQILEEDGYVVYDKETNERVTTTRTNTTAYIDIDEDIIIEEISTLALENELQRRNGVTTKRRNSDIDDGLFDDVTSSVRCMDSVNLKNLLCDVLDCSKSIDNKQLIDKLLDKIQ